MSARAGADDVQNEFAIVRELRACARSGSIPRMPRRSAIYAHVCAFADRDFETALHYFDRAFRLNPNLAIIWALSAPTYCYIGEPEKALKQLERYRELAPFHPYFFWVENLYTIAYMFLGDYEQAVQVGRRVVEDQSGIRQRLQAADRRARTSRTARGGEALSRQAAVARAEFHAASASRRAIRSRRSSTASATSKGCGSPACRRAERAGHSRIDLGGRDRARRDVSHPSCRTGGAP